MPNLLKPCILLEDLYYVLTNSCLRAELITKLLFFFFDCRANPIAFGYVGSIVEQLYSTANDLQTTNNLQNGPQMILIIHSTIRINVHVGKMHKRHGLDA